MPNAPILFLVHPLSYRVLKSVCNYIHGILERLSQSHVVFLRPEQIEDVSIRPGSVVFVVGDPYPRFPRDPASFFVFINFSLLYNVHRRFSMNWTARRWIRRKRRAMMARAPSYDMVIDYYSEQTSLLENAIRPLSIKVMPFLTNTVREVEQVPSLEERDWDVCVVGAQTPRRNKVYEQLHVQGCSLSPFQTQELGSTVANSRVTLNLHAYDCSNFEAARIVETLNLGCCLVTEPCHGIEPMFPPDCFQLAPYSRIADKVVELLRDHEKLKHLGDNARRYMIDEYASKAVSSWARIFDALPD